MLFFATIMLVGCPECLDFPQVPVERISIIDKKTNDTIFDSYYGMNGPMYLNETTNVGLHGYIIDIDSNDTIESTTCSFSECDSLGFIGIEAYYLNKANDEANLKIVFVENGLDIIDTVVKIKLARRNVCNTKRLESNEPPLNLTFEINN